jgi:CubicO group peptidase (beta-lactamase class C family)
MIRRAIVAGLGCLLLGAAPAAAQAPRICPEPGVEWERATPAEAGMDAQKLQSALDYGTQNLGFAVRVYRRGCLVGEDRFAASNRDQTYESYSMAKSVTALMFGRAMTLGLASPDDPVGSLVPEADAQHGAITLEHLLTMTSGLRWNPYRDYNVFTDGDRVRDALTLEPVRRPGEYFEYAQSTVTLLGAAVGRAVGDDAGTFVQRELMSPLGIEPGSWRWTRDDGGNVYGFWGVNMRPDDFGRLGELMRRRGVWRGERLLSEEFVRRATSPTRTNGCYGWLIWVNSAAPCIGPTIEERPVDDARMYPDLPADMYQFAGLFGQLVTVFPSQELVVVRTGHDPDLVFGGGAQWQANLYRRVLAAIVDQEVERPGDPEQLNDERTNADYGFQTAITEPDEYSRSTFQPRLPPAGPPRARAPILRLARSRPSRDGVVTAVLSCPARWPAPRMPRCDGIARLEGARRAVRYRVAAGRSARLRFRLSHARMRSLMRGGEAALDLVATNSDALGGVRCVLEAKLRRPARRG